MGGGATKKSSLNNSSTTSNKSKFFKPVVASSLALFLSAGVASASEPLGCASGGSNPKICYSMSNKPDVALSDFDGEGKLTWEADSTTSAFLPKYTDSSGSPSTPTTIENLVFMFNAIGSGAGELGKPEGSFANKTYTIRSNSQQKFQNFILDGQGKAIQMGANGTGTLKVDFGKSGTDTQRRFHLNLSNVTSGSFAFKGELEIISAKGDGTTNEARNGKFIGTFSKDMEGLIWVKKAGGNTFGFRSEFTFKDGANLKGIQKNFGIYDPENNTTQQVTNEKVVISSDSGVNTFVFENGDIEGAILSRSGDGTYSHNNIIFKNKDNKITGMVIANGGNNEILFEQGGTIEGELIAFNRENKVIMRGEEGKIDGGIGTAIENTANKPRNTVIMEATEKNTITGAIVAFGGTNEIIMGREGQGTSTIEDGIEARISKRHNGSSYLSGVNKVTMRGATTTIKEGITANGNSNPDGNDEGGINIITFADTRATSNSVEKAIDANTNGKNNIIVQGTKLTTEEVKSVSQGINAFTLGNNAELTIKELKAEADGLNTISVTQGSKASVNIKSKLEATGVNAIILDNANLTLKVEEAATQTGNNQITLKGDSKLFNTSTKLTLENLIFDDTKFYPQDLSSEVLAQRNAIVDLTLDPSDKKEFRLLTIGTKDNQDTGGIQGENGLFRIYVDNSKDSSTTATNKLGGVDAKQDSDTYGFAYSDRVIVHNVLDKEGQTTQTPLTEHIQVVTSTKVPLGSITYQGGGTENEGNVAIFTTKNNDKGEALVNLQSENSILGYDAITTELVGVKTDENGKVSNTSPYASNGIAPQANDDYTTYFIKSMEQAGASLANQKSVAVALGTNYELYLANLNSLNKRMGELRENANAHGTWARVFNGMQSTNFSSALDTRSIYTTVQAGYDYSFGFRGASNILGFALSYANSMSSSGHTKDHNGVFKGLRNANSNAFEFAIYNAYVQDGASKATGFKNGLYTDSILKLSFIMSNLNFLDQGDKTYNTSNLAFSFSQELGYRFLLGNNNEFFIDPQAEITLGFLNQSNLKQTLGNHFMDSIQDSILTLRNRVGSSFGYKFDQFTQNKGFNASLYLGTYFVGDLITGGDIVITTDSKKSVSFKPLASDMRFVMNLGTNFKIKDNTRIYFDFEKSFGGRISTDYQINLGVRYSFGTSAYTPYGEASTQEIKDTSTIKEVEPTKGYYIEVLEKEEDKLSNKEKKVLEKLQNNLKVQTKTHNGKAMKTYLVGPFKDEGKAKEGKTKLEGVLKELKGKGNILEVE